MKRHHSLPAALKAACALTLVYSAVGPAAAMERQSDIEQWMTSIDLNNDGYVTVDEYETARRNRFNELDKDRNGRLSQEEFIDVTNYSTGGEDYVTTTETIPAPKLQSVLDATFVKIDKNGDKEVSEQEYLQYGKDHFIVLDRNKDGKLTVDEFTLR